VDGAIQVYLNDQELEWKSNGLLDRSFYDWFSKNGKLKPGTHTLRIQQGFPANNTEGVIR